MKSKWRTCLCSRKRTHLRPSLRTAGTLVAAALRPINDRYGGRRGNNPDLRGHGTCLPPPGARASRTALLRSGKPGAQGPEAAVGPRLSGSLEVKINRRHRAESGDWLGASCSAWHALIAYGFRADGVIVTPGPLRAHNWIEHNSPHLYRPGASGPRDRADNDGYSIRSMDDEIPDGR